MEKMTLSPSSRQKSIMLLTFDEFQSKSGKNFGSMNMDEFLSNIWTSAEGDQLCLQSNNATGSGSSHVLIPTTIEKTLPNNSNSFSIPSLLCNKTVDEVWFEIQREKPPHQNLENFHTHEPLKCEPSFSHMTLEDFLVQVGIVQEAPALSPHHKTHPNDDNLCLAASIGMGRASVLGYVNNVPSNEFTQYEMATPSTIPLRESLNDFGNEDDDSANRKKRKRERSSDGPTEEAIKRRQRRMIKNRESAARSRARKQAYTVELELELNQIKQENEKLKQTVEKETERKRNHEVLMRKVYTTKAAEKTSSTRRCMSMSW